MISEINDPSPLSVREYFAAHAPLDVLLAENRTGSDIPYNMLELAQLAVDYADAVIEILSKEE